MTINWMLKKLINLIKKIVCLQFSFFEITPGNSAPEREMRRREMRLEAKEGRGRKY